MTKLRYTLPLLLTLILMHEPLFASELAREKRMADEIRDSIIDGDVVSLTAGDHRFMGIYTESDDASGVAIILHGRGFHPDWQDTVNPLRVGLAEAGWNTLSIQMPVLDKQAKYYDYLAVFPEALPRIDSAIEYARKSLPGQADTKVVLIAHSCGAHMAMAWVEANKNASEKIDAYIGIGMGATDYKQPMTKPFPLAMLTIPVLDVYADNDYPAVLKMAPERLAMINHTGNSQSRQLVITGADHYYINRGEELTRRIIEWLQNL